MATSYTSLRCDSCGGTLERDKARGVWVCIYCGNEMVREENYDGQFSIKYVARQALLSIAERDMASAKAQLVECQKIDPRYVGTTVVQLAYHVVLMSTAETPEKRRGLAAQIAEYYGALPRPSLAPGSEEEGFYESLESSDAYGLLALVYDSVGDEAREKFVLECIDPTSVHSASAARDIAGYALSEGNYALVDQLVASPADLDCDFLFGQIITRYPDMETKAINVRRVAPGVNEKDAAVRVLDTYLASTADGLETRLSITTASQAAGIVPAVDVCLSALLPLCSEQTQAQQVLDAVCARKLTDEDVARVLTVCASSASAPVAVLGIEKLKTSGQFVSPSQANVLTVLGRQDLAAEDKVALLKALLGFDLPDRFRQSVISTYLREGKPAPDRPQMVEFLTTTVGEVNPVLIEDYVTHFATDAASKPPIVSALLSKSTSASTLKRALSNYLAASPDTQEVTQGVLNAFGAHGLISPDVDVVAYVSRRNDIEHSIETIRQMKASGWQPGTRSLDTYLRACAQGATYSARLASELFSQDCSISGEALGIYVLRCVEPDAGKPRWVQALASRAPGSSGTIHGQIQHQGRGIDCNLLQAYLLAAPDPDAVIRAVLAVLDDGTGAAEAAISVSDASGTTSMKFKRYAGASKESLSQAAREYCESHKLLGGLF